MYLQPLAGLLEGQLKSEFTYPKLKPVWRSFRKHLSCLFTGHFDVEPTCCVVSLLGFQRRSFLLFSRTQLYDSVRRARAVASELSISGPCLLVSLASSPLPPFSCTILCHQIITFPNRTLSDYPARWLTPTSHRLVRAAPYSSCYSQAPHQLDSVWDSIASLEWTRPYRDRFRTFLISVFTLDVRSPSMLSIFTIVALVLDVSQQSSYIALTFRTSILIDYDAALPVAGSIILVHLFSFLSSSISSHRILVFYPYRLRINTPRLASSRTRQLRLKFSSLFVCVRFRATVAHSPSRFPSSLVLCLSPIQF